MIRKPMCKRTLIGFFLALLLNCAGCGAMLVFVEDYFEDQNSLREAQKYVKTELEQISPLFPDGDSCRLPAFFWPDNTIVRVEPSGTQFGLRTGDRILTVDGSPRDDWQGILPLVIKHKPEEELNITLVRDGVQLERKVKCMDGQPLKDKWIAALDAASDGQWHDCAAISEELDRPPLSPFSEIALLRYHCNEGDRVTSYHMATEADAKLLYEARVRQLEEAKYVPGGMEKIKGKVLNAIDWLERNDFRPIANALRVELSNRSSP